MIKVGKGKPNIKFNKISYDMGYITPAHFSCNDWFWMNLNDYMDKQEFEHFTMKDISYEERSEIIKRGTNLKESDAIYKCELNDDGIENN